MEIQPTPRRHARAGAPVFSSDRIWRWGSWGNYAGKYGKTRNGLDMAGYIISLNYKSSSIYGLEMVSHFSKWVRDAAKLPVFCAINI